MTPFNQQNQQIETQYNAGYIAIHQQPLSLTEAQHKQNRARMLQRVHTIWIKGVLEPSKQGTARIALELQNKPSAIITPWWHVLREFHKTGPLCPAETSITDVYDQAHGELLILGEPGAGKTTLLLEITCDLLERAHRDEAHPMPIVFSLSSWATKRQPLTEWLISELHARYQIPLQLAMSWIEQNQVLPLLDGLDEVAAPHREDCVKAINIYRREHGLVPIVVCCRQDDYFALTLRLLLHTAVVVQPLTTEQIESYLTSGDEGMKSLLKTLREDADLRALANTPLMLNVLTVAYQETPPEQVTATSSLGMKQVHIFASYVQRMLTRRNINTPYTSQQTIHWLSSLARQMKQQSQTIFYVEQMQPHWLLDHPSLLRGYNWLGVQFPALLIGMLVSLPIPTLFFGFINFHVFFERILLGGWLGLLLSTDPYSLVNEGEGRSLAQKRFLRSLGRSALLGSGMGLIAGLPGDSTATGWSSGASFGVCSVLLLLLLRKVNKAEGGYPTTSSIWKKRWSSLINNTSIYNGVLTGIVIGMSYGLRDLHYWPNDRIEHVLQVALLNALSNGLNNGLIGGLLSVLIVGRSSHIQLVDQLAWSWRNLRRSLFSGRHIRRAMQITAISAIVGGLTHLPDRMTPALLLRVGLSFGLNYWLLFGLFQGILSETVEDQSRLVPNQGIRRSASHSLVLGFICFPIVGLAGTLINVLLHWDLFIQQGMFGDIWSYRLSDNLTIALCVALLTGLLMGGLTCLRHYILRLLLWHAKLIPWNFVCFLDYATEHLLLRRIGGGSIFLHQLLLDYFTHLETESGPTVSVEGR